MDGAQQSTARVEAAQKLAQECRDYSVWQTLCSIVASEDEDPVVRCGLIQALPNWNRYAAVNFLTRARTENGIRVLKTALANASGSAPESLRRKSPRSVGVESDGAFQAGART